MVYDYSYFNEISALEKADNFMATGEFSAAGDALTFLQKKDPHNPKVLERLMLVSYKLKSLSDLNNKNTLDSISGDPKNTEWILDEAQGDSREQLVRLHGKIESAFKAARINKEILKVREEKESYDPAPRLVSPDAAQSSGLFRQRRYFCRHSHLVHVFCSYYFNIDGYLV